MSTNVSRVYLSKLCFSVVQIDLSLPFNEEISLFVYDPLALRGADSNAKMDKIG